MPYLRELILDGLYNNNSYLNVVVLFAIFGLLRDIQYRVRIDRVDPRIIFATTIFYHLTFLKLNELFASEINPKFPI